MLPDATFFIWWSGSRLALSHAPCGEELLYSTTNLDMDKVVAAINGHNCPGITPIAPEGSEA
jgi:hypothetical protein